MQKFTVIFLLLVGINLTHGSCKKQSNNVVMLPPAEASLIRNLVFTKQTNVEKNVSYGASQVKTTAGTDNGNFFIRLYTESNIPGTASESVVLYINESHLTSNLAKGYSFGTIEPALKRVYYTYTFHESGTSSWTSITDSGIGVVFQGVLNITSYDEKNKLVSGSYLLKARKLITDPTIKSIAEPIDPMNECDLTLTGDFSNIRIR
ncbi:MAG TPA: hypothetical protein VFV46_07125 [Lacibacter sp.]|nr:hypothetical protein [Lacibacter sp.]